MKIGVLSDTHDFLDPRIPELFAEVDHILHAGDIGMPWLIMDLEAIAPVTAVRGNSDDLPHFEDTQMVVLGGKKVLVHHIVNPLSPLDNIRKRIHREEPAVVVFGHTHQGYAETIGKIFYFNPGYAGRPRLNTPRTVGLIHWDGNEIRGEFKSLD